MLPRQKKLPHVSFAAAKGSTAFLCVILILVMAVSVFVPMAVTAASNRQTIQESLEKTTAAFDAAEPIYQRLRETIAEEIAALDVEDDSDTDLEESETGYQELIDYVKQLDDLKSGLNGLSEDMNSSEGKTVRALKEYISMLSNMSADLAELVRYSIDMYYAIEPFDMLDGDTDDFSILADQIWTGCESVRVLMEEIKPPAYLAITHNDMKARITEFRDFGEDFYYACYLEDPLRIYSCVYRMNRIIRMFDICGDNLNADIELQFAQADRRLNVIIAQLNGELAKNLETLNTAQGRAK